MYPEVPYPPVVIFSKTSDGRWLVSDYFGHHVAGRGPTGWNRPSRAPSPGLSSCPKDLLDRPALFLFSRLADRSPCGRDETTTHAQDLRLRQAAPELCW